MNKKEILLSIGAAIVAVIIYSFAFAPLGTGGAGITRKCNVQTVSAVTVGHQLSSTLVSAYSNNAWVRIQVPSNATNTYSLSFDSGVAATVGNGLELNGLGGTTTENKITFGLNTDFPYVGAVTGITDQGSTTLLVTECRY